MKKLITAVATLVFMTGCTGLPETPDSEVQVPANAAACEAFSRTTERLGDPFSQDNVVEPWNELRANFDRVALTADGDVRLRISELVDRWPDASTILFGDKGKSLFNELIDSVSLACEVSDAPINVTKFS